MGCDAPGGRGLSRGVDEAVIVEKRVTCYTLDEHPLSAANCVSFVLRPSSMLLVPPRSSSDNTLAISVSEVRN